MAGRVCGPVPEIVLGKLAGDAGRDMFVFFGMGSVARAMRMGVSSWFLLRFRLDHGIF